MDRSTVRIYEEQWDEWVLSRSPGLRAGVEELAQDLPADAVRADLGCGPGWYSAALGHPVVALDAARPMLDLVAEHAPGALRVQGDLEALPLRGDALGGVWASASYVHVPSRRLPMALADLHRACRLDALAELVLFEGDFEGSELPGDDFPGRFFAHWQRERLDDVLTGAGFAVERVRMATNPVGHRRFHVRLRRLRTLSDTVGPGMRLLVCGLNPSLYAADAGVGYARPGNRFWPAALAAGIVSRDRDARHALVAHGVGFTDLVKRATVAANELLVDEYEAGLARVLRLVDWLRPGAVCFVGLAGWRAVVDRRAKAGLQATDIVGTPVYLMPSTSGRNSRSRPSDAVEHLMLAAALADGA